MHCHIYVDVAYITDNSLYRPLWLVLDSKGSVFVDQCICSHMATIGMPYLWFIPINGSKSRFWFIYSFISYGLLRLQKKKKRTLRPAIVEFFVLHFINK